MTDAKTTAGQPPAAAATAAAAGDGPGIEVIVLRECHWMGHLFAVTESDMTTKSGPNRPAADIQRNGRLCFGVHPNPIILWASKQPCTCAYCCMFWAHFVASEATTVSKQPQRSDLTSYLESVTSITYSTYPCVYWFYVLGPFCGLWGHYSSKQPQRSDLNSDLPTLFLLFESLFIRFWKRLQNLPLLDLSASPHIKSSYKVPQFN